MPSVSEAGRRALLRLARQSVTDAVLHQRLPDDVPQDAIFAERVGAFVTLLVRGRLHGCIGVAEPDQRLGDTIIRCSASAALQDPRFPPLVASDLDHLQIEISLLSLLTPIRPEEIKIGLHGLTVSSGSRRGLLLPQVAVKHALDREQFLREICRKAELPPEAWRDSQTELRAFTCQVIADEADSPYA